MNLFNFGGITIHNVKEGYLEDNFKYIYDTDTETIYLSNKTYQHREEGLNFNYKYAISAIYDEEQEGSNAYIEVYLVVSPECLHEKVRNDIKNSSGGYCDYFDIIEYGLSVRMLYENKPYSEKKVYEVMNGVSCLVEHIDRFRGFSLDRYVNKIGNTGWDIINSCLDGESFINKSPIFKEIGEKNE